MNIPKYLIIHHVGGTDATPLMDTSNFSFKQCDELHKQRFNFKSSLGYYVGYQYFIEKDGKVYQARKDTEEGAHTIGKNNSSIGICLSGNFDATMPTKEQIESLRVLLKTKMAEFNIPLSNIVPHRTFAVKTCYGNKLPDNWAQKLFSIDNNKPKYRFTVAMSYSYTPSEAVKALQNILKWEKVLRADFPIDGKFLDETARGLKTWQISHGITDFQLESDPRKIRAGLKTIIKLNELYS